jgi:hypothetical protein
MAFKMKYKGFPKRKDYLDDKKNPDKKKNDEAGPGIGETKEEVAEANALEDANNSPAAMEAYARMMKNKN